MAEKTEKKYVITNHRSGKVLASCGGSAVQMTANSGETQVWCAVPAEGTSVQLVHKVSGLALTVPGEAENGTALVLAEAQGNASQLWKLTTTVKGCRRTRMLRPARSSTSRTSAMQTAHRHSFGSS